MRIGPVLLALGLVCGTGFAAESLPVGSGRFHFEKRIEADLEYLLHVPREYNSDTLRRWPLVLFLHGSGERGSNLQTVTVHGPPKLVRQGRDLPFILLAPQCPADEHWQNEVLLGLIDRIIASHRVDTNRVYLTGLSMGGYGTWYLGMKHPERFAALAPICGGGQVLDVLLADNRKSELQRMPVWAFHGLKDTVVPVSESEQMIAALKKLGNPDPRLTLYPDAGHDSWMATYDNPDFFTWLLAQTREGRFLTKP